MIDDRWKVMDRWVDEGFRRRLTPEEKAEQLLMWERIREMAERCGVKFELKGRKR